MSARTWTREPIAPAEGVGKVYRRGDYQIQRLGRDSGWMVWHGDDFLAPVQRLAEGKALAWRHEIAQAWTEAHYEQRARGLSDWNLRQAHAGAVTRRDATQTEVYAGEIERRHATRALVEERGRTQYTMRAYRAPFSGEVFNHIVPPVTRYTMCHALYSGPGEPLDLTRVDCQACVDAYMAARTSPTTKERA